MSDRFPAWIEIGGDLPRTLLEHFLKMLRRCGGGAKPEGGFNGKTEDSLGQLYRPEGTLFLQASQAADGQFWHLERWCQEHNVSFDRHSDAYYGCDSILARFRPGRELSQSLSASDGGEYVALDDVISAKNALADGNFFKAMMILNTITDGRDTIEPLRPFRVVKGGIGSG
jgi:hypothetical protein